ncbi:hypothetical protein ABT124_43135 [Streptomyces sp. NPDC001982]|uniref:hypothetical protein n=1 Tax=unclassified Streptomyces TaxID=2593676 RepID=UPI0033209A4C
MSSHSLRLDLTNGKGAVILDGNNISHSIRSLNLQATAGQPPRVILEPVDLEPVVHTADVTAAETVVTIPDATAQLLITLGWTPPADDTE